MVERPLGREAGGGGLGELVRAGLVRSASLVSNGASASELGVESSEVKSACVSSEAFLSCWANEGIVHCPVGINEGLRGETRVK